MVKRGLLAGLLLLALGVTQSAPARPAAAVSSLQGDVNCNEAVNAVDALQVLRSVAGLATSAACLGAAADTNCDGSANAVDALRILRYVAGLANSVPAGCVAIGEVLVLPPTSEELIGAALVAGSITYEESLLYRAYALYDHPDLPDEFRSPVMYWEAAMDLFEEIEANQATLSQGLLDALAPFMARPADPVSIFNNPPAPAGGAATTATAASWESVATPTGDARVWVKASPTTSADLAKYSALVQKAWTNLSGIFPYPNPDEPSATANPDNKIDFYFMDWGEIDPRMAGCASVPLASCRLMTGKAGVARNAPGAAGVGNGWSGYLLVHVPNPDEADLIDTIAHELTHVSQNKYDKNETVWLNESTATWAAHKVLKKLNLTPTYAYNRLPTFFQGLEQSIQNLDSYASWPFFLFASMEQGNGIVTTVWEKAAPAGQQGIQAVNDALPLDQSFDEFSVRNWNQAPVTPLYRSPDPGDPTFPGNHKPKLTLDKTLIAPLKVELNADVAPLAAKYSRFTVSRLVTNSIVFKNELHGVEHAHVWAIKKIGTQWKPPEDWTDSEEKIFCLDDDNLTELIIVISNSGMSNNLPGPNPTIEALASGCRAWVGTVKWTKAVNDGFTIGTATLQSSGPVRFELDEGNSTPVESNYNLVSGNLTWSFTGTWPGGCTLSGGGTKKALGSLTVKHSVTPNTYYGGYAPQGIGTEVLTVECPGFPPQEYPYAFTGGIIGQCPGGPVYALPLFGPIVMNDKCTDSENFTGPEVHEWNLHKSP